MPIDASRLRASLIAEGFAAARRLSNVPSDRYALSADERTDVDSVLGAFELLAGIACTCNGGFHRRMSDCPIITSSHHDRCMTPFDDAHLTCPIVAGREA